MVPVKVFKNIDSPTYSDTWMAMHMHDEQKSVGSIPIKAGSALHVIRALVIWPAAYTNDSKKSYGFLFFLTETRFLMVWKRFERLSFSSWPKFLILFSYSEAAIKWESSNTDHKDVAEPDLFESDHRLTLTNSRNTHMLACTHGQ